MIMDLLAGHLVLLLQEVVVLHQTQGLVIEFLQKQQEYLSLHLQVLVKVIEVVLQTVLKQDLVQ